MPGNRDRWSSRSDTAKASTISANSAPSRSKFRSHNSGRIANSPGVAVHSATIVASPSRNAKSRPQIATGSNRNQKHKK
jgi:hypothetical protein